MNIFDKLPDDIQILILNKYLIFPQDNILLNDIRSFDEHRNKIFKIYEKIGYEYGNDYMDEFNIYSIIDNDLMAFWNDDVDYLIGVTDKNYIKMFRQLAFNIKNDKDSIMANYNFHLNTKTSPKTKINRYLAGLTIDERDSFIKLLFKI
jgi:hypothetical protein